MRAELQNKPTDWDSIYYEFQAVGLSDPRWHCNRFDSQPISVIKKQLEAIQNRDKTLANVFSISSAKCGLVSVSSESKLTLLDFLPFPEEYGDKSEQATISISTAKIFMAGVKDKTIPSKVIGACSRYMNEIIRLSES